MNIIEEITLKMLHKLSWKKIMLEAKNNQKRIDHNNPEEMYNYYLNNGIMPTKTIENEDGTWTHIYENGLTINGKVTLSGIKLPSSEKKLELKKNNRYC